MHALPDIVETDVGTQRLTATLCCRSRSKSIRRAGSSAARRPPFRRSGILFLNGPAEVPFAQDFGGDGPDEFFARA